MMKFSQKAPSSNFNLKTSKKRDSSIQEFDVFGKDLKMLLELSYSKEIPDLIFIFGYFIKNYGLLVQGIFRVSGNKTRMDEIKSNYVQKKLIEVTVDDIHNITGLYKLFLREVPGGLIPYSQAIDLIKATKIHKKNENLDLITTELLKLPVPHYNLLKFTCSLLNHVAKCCGSNLMHSENLGTVFGPTFFSSIEDISLLSITNTTATVLIQSYNELFKVSAPVHTNLNQMNENGNKYIGLSTVSSNGNVSKCSNDHNITMKFGDSYLLINISNDNDNSFLSNSFQDEEPIPYSDRQESSNLSNSFTNTPQISNSLALALKMCVNNHLFDQLDETDISNVGLYNPPSLISNMMFNGYHPGFHHIVNQNNFPQHYSSIDRNMAPILEKKRGFEDDIKSAYPRRVSYSNTQQTSLNSFENSQQNNLESFNKSDTLPTQSKFPVHTEATHDRPVNLVPTLDLSTLVEQSEPEDIKSQFKSNAGDGNKQTLISKQQKINNARHTIHESKILDTDSHLDQIQRKISALKQQLRQFDESYTSNNGVKPDKSTKHKNEWYQKTLFDMKLLRLEKEQILNSFGKTKDIESDSVPNIRKKLLTGSGDATDQKFSSVTPIDNRSVNSRPVSVLSESVSRFGVNNESARSNTLNSIGVNSSIIEDLSPRECENLKLTLDQISNHLREERFRDNRPEELDLMTHEQIECEKVTMQKALLNFESKYGRRKNPNAIQLMRPLYDRYRQVKKRLTQNFESLGYDPKSMVQRTLDNRTKSITYQSAWTSSKPLSPRLPTSNYFSVPQSNNLDVIMPSNIQFDTSDIGDDSLSCGINQQDSNSKVPDQAKFSQSNRRNVNTFQYRKKTTPGDFNNNNNILKSSTMNNEDIKSEFQKLLKDKKELQRILKDFENKFERDTKRKVEKSDRLPMEREYARYKMIKNRIKELEESFDNSMS